MFCRYGHSVLLLLVTALSLSTGIVAHVIIEQSHVAVISSPCILSLPVPEGRGGSARLSSYLTAS